MSFVVKSIDDDSGYRVYATHNMTNSTARLIAESLKIFGFNLPINVNSFSEYIQM